MCPRAMHPCGKPGCPALVRAGQSYCEEHKPAQAPKPSLSKRGYGPEWYGIRRDFLAHHPTCEMCGAPSTDAHHVNGLAAGHGRDNLAALCHSCHAKITAQETGGWQRGRR